MNSAQCDFSTANSGKGGNSMINLRLCEPRDILCFPKTDSGAIDIVRDDKHPKLKDWKKDVDLATLHTAGVLQ